MKILVVDQDSLTVQMLRSKLEPLGHKLFEEATKNAAVERMVADDFQIVMIDPSPLNSPRQVILNARRRVKNYPYMLVMSKTIAHDDAVKGGGNDLITKPIDSDALYEKIENAERLIRLVNHIGNDAEDFPSAGGVIAKSAFNQLFLSGMERADRYGERTFVLQISLSNYKEILAMDGHYAADFAEAKLCKYLVLLRRQSDIIGQTGKGEYSLLLQRPIYETEPVEAANRFAEQLSHFTDIVEETASTPAEISVRLIDIPGGREIVRHLFKPGQGELPAHPSMNKV